MELGGMKRTPSRHEAPKRDETQYTEGADGTMWLEQRQQGDSILRDEAGDAGMSQIIQDLIVCLRNMNI